MMDPEEEDQMLTRQIEAMKAAKEILEAEAKKNEKKNEEKKGGKALTADEHFFEYFKETFPQFDGDMALARSAYIKLRYMVKRANFVDGDTPVLTNPFLDENTRTQPKQAPKMSLKGYPIPSGDKLLDKQDHYSTFDLRVAVDTKSWVGHATSAREVHRLLTKLIEKYMDGAFGKTAVLAHINSILAVAEDVNTDYTVVQDAIMAILNEMAIYNHDRCKKKSSNRIEYFKTSADAKILSQKLLDRITRGCTSTTAKKRSRQDSDDDD